MLPDAIAHLVEAGHAAPSADNIQPWRFAWTGESLEVRFDEQRMSGHLFGPRALATELAMGAVLENIEQVALVGIDSWAITETSRALYARLPLCAVDQALGTGSPQAVLDRHTNRWPYRRKPLPDALLSHVGAMTHGAARVVVDDDRRTIHTIARAVGLASQARFRTREIHRWLQQSLRFGPAAVARGDGLALETLALPPGGGALLRWLADWPRMERLNRFGAYRGLARLERAPVAAAPAVVAIVAPDGAGIDAGRLMQRVWIALNQQRVAVHPSYVVPDQIDRLDRGLVPQPLLPTVDALGRLLKTVYGAAEPRILLRVGFPRRSDVPRSRRLPPRAICDDLTAANAAARRASVPVSTRVAS